MTLLSPAPLHVRSEYGATRSASSDGALRYRPQNNASDLLLRPVVVLHGRSGDARLWEQGSAYGDVCASLTAAGCLVDAIDAAGLAPWGNATAVASVDAEITALLTLTGATQVDLVGWGEGGLLALNYLALHAARVRTVQALAPVTDVVWMHDTSPGAATYAPEINTAYGGSGSYLANSLLYDPHRSYAALLAAGGTKPVRIVHGDSDTIVPLSQTTGLLTLLGNPAAWTLDTVVGADHVSVVSRDYTTFPAFLAAH